MIIFGTGTKHLASPRLDNAQCPSCGNNTLQGDIYQKYFHIFWIPVFPYRKIAIGQCSHCTFVLEEKKIPAILRSRVDIEKQNAKTPFYMFAGSILILIGIGAINFSERLEQQKTQAFLANPRVNDHYVVDIDDPAEPSFKYLVFRIKNVSSDSIEFLIGQYAYNLSFGAEEAIQEGDVKMEGYFLDEKEVIAKSDLDGKRVMRVIRSNA